MTVRETGMPDDRGDTALPVDSDSTPEAAGATRFDIVEYMELRGEALTPAEQLAFAARRDAMQDTEGPLDAEA